ncbi:hypothetical protein E2320_020080 [Naja naja]|nr:hypothetical protein E2320_020080 [Naja naja]
MFLVLQLQREKRTEQPKNTIPKSRPDKLRDDSTSELPAFPAIGRDMDFIHQQVRMPTAMLAPQTVKAVSWEELQEVLGNHYAPKPSRIARHHAFRQRTQAENESVSEYVAALRSAALYCGFRDQLDDMLLDQLVCGVRDLRLQRRLLAKADLTLKQGIEEARAAELSSVSAAAIQKSINVPGSKPSTAINYEAAAYEDEYLEEEEEDSSGMPFPNEPEDSSLRPNKAGASVPEELTVCY